MVVYHIGILFSLVTNIYIKFVYIIIDANMIRILRIWKDVNELEV